jgi:hypothetical protein
MTTDTRGVRPIAKAPVAFGIGISPRVGGMAGAQGGSGARSMGDGGANVNRAAAAA